MSDITTTPSVRLGPRRKAATASRSARGVAGRCGTRDIGRSTTAALARLGSAMDDRGLIWMEDIERVTWQACADALTLPANGDSRI